MPAFTTTALLLGAAGAGTALGLRKRAARKKEEAAANAPIESILGPAPTAPPTTSPVFSQSQGAAINAAQVARRRARAGSIGSPSKVGATGAQTGIKTKTGSPRFMVPLGGAAGAY